MYDKPVNSDEMNGPLVPGPELNSPPQDQIYVQPPGFQQPPPMYQNPPPQYQPTYQPPTAQPVYQPPVAQPVYQQQPGVNVVQQPVIQIVQQNNTATPVIQSSVTYYSSNDHLKTDSCSAYCPFCKKSVMSVPETSCSCSNFICCLFTYPFLFIPWCWFQSSRGKELNCLNAVHKCPICGSIIGNYNAC